MNIEIDSSDKTENLLPEIPEGYIRLTHFTNQNIAEAIVEEGNNFTYKELLTSTTDSFSNNADIIDLITTGKTGSFQRDSFGEYVLLIDLEKEEHKNRCTIGYCTDDEIPNHNILGYVFRKDIENLHKNPKYNPKINELSRVENTTQRETNETDIPVVNENIPKDTTW